MLTEAEEIALGERAVRALEVAPVERAVRQVMSATLGLPTEQRIQRVVASLAPIGWAVSSHVFGRYKDDHVVVYKQGDPGVRMTVRL